MSTNKRTIEVFTAGCPVCRETIDLVRQTVEDAAARSSNDDVKEIHAARPP
ncbi:MAG: hypothetical protein WKH64_16685 [Chloroflexia bacterium]